MTTTESFQDIYHGKATTESNQLSEKTKIPGEGPCSEAVQ